MYLVLYKTESNPNSVKYQHYISCIICCTLDGPILLYLTFHYSLRYDWNIVESGVIHHNTYLPFFIITEWSLVSSATECLSTIIVEMYLDIDIFVICVLSFYIVFHSLLSKSIYRQSMIFSRKSVSLHHWIWSQWNSYIMLTVSSRKQLINIREDDKYSYR